MSKEFGPSRLQRLEQNSQAREEMLRQYRRVLTGQMDEGDQVEDLVESILTHKKRRQIPKAANILGITVTGLSAFAGICSGENKEQEGEPNGEVGNIKNTLTLPLGETPYLTAGPHSDGLSGGVKYAIDLAPRSAISCPGGIPLRDALVMSAMDGEVTTKGDENNKNDPNHSIVEVTNSSGLTTGYMHLKDIKVQKGQKVQRGTPLGNASCEFPPGGSSSGIHLHFDVKKDGKPVPIEGVTLSGWEIVARSGNYQGMMVWGSEVRTADKRRCGPDEQSIKACGGIRNDLVSGGNVLGARTTPTAEQTTVAMTEREERQAEVNARLAEAKSKAQEIVSLLMSGAPSDFQKVFEMQLPKEMEAQYWPYNKATLQQIASCSSEMRSGEFQDAEYARHDNYSYSPVDLSDTDRLNLERGLLPRERYAIGVNFHLRAVNRSSGQRQIFRDFDYLNYETDIIFELANGQLYLASLPFCIGGRTPLRAW